MARTEPMQGIMARLRLKRSDEHGHILLSRARAAPETVLLRRIAIVAALFLFVIGVTYADRAGLKDQADNEISLSDVVYFTMITVTTTGYGDIVPVSPRARMVDAFLITPIRMIVWFIFIGTAYELVLQRVLEDWRMTRLQRKLDGHVVICGYGSSGEVAAAELIRRGDDPAAIIVIDVDPARAREAADRGLSTLQGEVTREDMLRVAGVERARAVIICVDRDETTALATLTVRGLGSKARIVATVREEENAKLLRTSGADELVLPWRLGGCLLATAVSDVSSVALVQDIISHGGALELKERAVLPAEIGVAPAAVPQGLVVQVKRGERTLSFWEFQQLLLQAGDRIALIAKPESSI